MGLSLPGGSWVVRSRVISRVTILITHIRGLITLLIATPEPPSSYSQIRVLSWVLGFSPWVDVSVSSGVRSMSVWGLAFHASFRVRAWVQNRGLNSC